MMSLDPTFPNRRDSKCATRGRVTRSTGLMLMAAAPRKLGLAAEPNASSLSYCSLDACAMRLRVSAIENGPYSARIERVFNRPERAARSSATERSEDRAKSEYKNRRGNERETD
ncbi:unnamed protein product, partial [Iphiclides podalirius]